MAASPLDHILRHNTWATGALIEFCRTLDPAKLDANARGTYGTLSGTLQHLVGAEQWYAQLLSGEIIGRRIRRTDAPHSLDELATIAAATGARLVEVAASDDPTRIIVTNEPRRSTVGVVLAQLVHHGNEHRTQATTILGANGIEPPALSAWAYGRAMRVSTTEE
ncbi:MAG: DinB family protein [Chloroflexota bacterium]